MLSVRLGLEVWQCPFSFDIHRIHLQIVRFENQYGMESKQMVNRNRCFSFLSKAASGFHVSVHKDGFSSIIDSISHSHGPPCKTCKADTPHKA